MSPVNALPLAALALVPAFANEPVRDANLTDVADVVAGTSAQCLRLWDHFRSFVAEERDVQQVFSKTGVAHRRREIVSDYYIVRTPSSHPDDRAGLLEFRDVLAVDGRKIRRKADGVMQLLTRPGGGSAIERCRILSACNRHNLLFGSSLVISFTAGLAGYVLADPAIPTNWRLAPEKTTDPEEVVLCFEEGARASRASQGACAHPVPAPATGCAHISRADHSIRRVEVMLTLGSGPMRSRMIVEYEPGPDGIRIPARRMLQILHPKWANGVAGQADATYANYRRFRAESQIEFAPER
jgi:hypothetical protein